MRASLHGYQCRRSISFFFVTKEEAQLQAEVPELSDKVNAQRKIIHSFAHMAKPVDRIKKGTS